MCTEIVEDIFKGLFFFFTRALDSNTNDCDTKVAIGMRSKKAPFVSSMLSFSPDQSQSEAVQIEFEPNGYEN